MVEIGFIIIGGLLFTFLLVGIKIMLQSEACHNYPLQNKCRAMEDAYGYNMCDHYNMIYGNGNNRL